MRSVPQPGISTRRSRGIDSIEMLLVARVDAQQHDAVGAPLVAGDALAAVAAQHEDVLGLVRGVR